GTNAPASVATPSIANSGMLNFDIPAAGTLTYGGVISGSGTLNATGPGTIALSGNNTYSGPTNIQAGTPATQSNNALGINSDVTVGGAGTLTVQGQHGLLGQYYNIAPANNNGNNGDAAFNSLSALQTSLAGKTPALTQISSAAGLNNSFDF